MESAKKDNKIWETMYPKRVRTTDADDEYIEKNKGDLTKAGFVHFMIQFYKANKKRYYDTPNKTK